MVPGPITGTKGHVQSKNILRDSRFEHEMSHLARSFLTTHLHSTHNFE